GGGRGGAGGRPPRVGRPAGGGADPVRAGDGPGRADELGAGPRHVGLPAAGQGGGAGRAVLRRVLRRQTPAGVRGFTTKAQRAPRRRDTKKTKSNGKDMRPSCLFILFFVFLVSLLLGALCAFVFIRFYTPKIRLTLSRSSILPRSTARVSVSRPGFTKSSASTFASTRRYMLNFGSTNSSLYASL